MMTIDEFIAEDEGLRLRVYDDATGELIVPGYTVKGHPTIGFGRALDVNGITLDEAIQLRHNSITVATRDALRHIVCFPQLSRARQYVIISMFYQMGSQGVLGFKKMLLALHHGDYAQAAREMLLSQWSEQTPRRAQKLAEIMRTDRLSVI